MNARDCEARAAQCRSRAAKSEYYYDREWQYERERAFADQARALRQAQSAAATDMSSANTTQAEIVKRLPVMRTNYYDTHAVEYFNATAQVDMAALRGRFLQHVPPGGALLDAGCGSGRDARAFMLQGYRVNAFDACAELARLASTHADITVQVMTFMDLSTTAHYDGIWACASLLHVPEAQQPEALSRLCLALKPGGVLYASYKRGDSEREDEMGRPFTDANEGRVEQWLTNVPGIRATEVWVSKDIWRPQAPSWLNLLVHISP